jgi:hypothetical protein
MTPSVEKVAEPRPIRSSTPRVRRYRERCRERLRFLTLEMPETAIDGAVARGFLAEFWPSRPYTFSPTLSGTCRQKRSPRSAHDRDGDNRGLAVAFLVAATA